MSTISSRASCFSTSLQSDAQPPRCHARHSTVASAHRPRELKRGTGTRRAPSGTAPLGLGGRHAQAPMRSRTARTGRDGENSQVAPAQDPDRAKILPVFLNPRCAREWHVQIGASQGGSSRFVTLSRSASARRAPTAASLTRPAGRRCARAPCTTVCWPVLRARRDYRPSLGPHPTRSLAFLGVEARVAASAFALQWSATDRSVPVEVVRQDRLRTAPAQRMLA